MASSVNSGQPSRPRSQETQRPGRGTRRRTASREQRRLNLEKLVARELLAADVPGIDLSTDNSIYGPQLSAVSSGANDSAILEATHKTKEAQLAAGLSEETPTMVDHWLLSWSEDQAPQQVYGPSFIRSIEPTGLIKDAYLVQFHQAVTEEGAIAELGLQHQPELVYPMVAEQVTKRLIPTDGLFFTQYHLHNTGQFAGTAGIDLNIVETWDDYQGNGVTIGIVDDGVDYNHPDLSPNYNAAIDIDFNGNDNDALPNATNDWHGTAVAGLAAGAIGFYPMEGGGIVGAAPQADITGIRLTAAATTDAQNAAALNHQMNNIDIYSNSWGPADTGSINTTGQAGPLARAALENGAQNGRGGLGSVYVWAVGNGGGFGDNMNYDMYANSRHTIAVGSMTHTGVETTYSERGASLIVVAPGNGAGTAQGVVTSDVMGPFGYSTDGWARNDPNRGTLFTGTSAAAPQVAGVVALMLEANPNLTQRDVQHILINSARLVDAGDPDWVTNSAGHQVNEKFGFGLVSAADAVALAETWTNKPEEISWDSALFTPNLAIPDANTTGVDFDFGVPDNFQIEYIELQADIPAHTWGGDLVLKLTSPGGTESFLTRTNGSTATYTFNHTLTTARHWDEDTFGDWTLNVSDRFSGDTGILERLSVKVYGYAVDTALPNLSAENVTANEADGTIDFEIVLESAQATDVTFEAVTFDGSAVGGVDYTPLVNAPFTIPAGQTSVTVSVALIQDNIEEIAKTFSLGLTNFVGSDPLVRAAVGEIIDDDDPAFYTGNAFVQVGLDGLLVSESLANPILINSATDIDDLQFEAAPNSLGSAILTPDSPTVVLTAQFVDSAGDPIAPSVTAGGPGQVLQLPLTELVGDGDYAVRVWSNGITSNVNIELMLNSVNEAWNGDTAGNSSQSITSSLLTLGSGRFAVTGDLTADPNAIAATKTNNPAVFVDISGTGTPLPITDETRATFTPSNFSGNSLMPAGVFTVGDNGMIVAGTTGSTPTWNNQGIPYSVFTRFLAPFWDDLDPSSGDITWQETTIDGKDALVIQWTNVPHWSFGGASTFQVQLFDTGSTLARFVYQDVDFGSASANNGASATIGYQISQQNFFQFSRNTAGAVVNGDVITFANPEDIDRYTVDLTGMAGEKIDVLFEALDSANLAGSIVRLIGTDGTTVLATASATPSGFAPTNYDQGILGFTVPSDGVYTLEIATSQSGRYQLAVTSGLAFDTETNDAIGDPLRALDLTVGGYGYVDAAGDATDFYSVNLNVDDYMIFRTTTPLDGDGANLLDPSVSVYSPSGTLLVTNDNSADDGKNAHIRFRALEAGTFKLAVNAVSGDGAYVLHVDEWINILPSDIILSNDEIAENSAADATIGTLTAVDGDPEDNHIFALVAGDGDADNASFTIDGNTLKAAESFDFETKNSYSIRLRTEDQRGGAFEKIFVISVTDVNEVPTDLALSPTAVDENSALDTVVGSFTTTDVDAGDTFTYTLVAGTGDDDNASFSIDGADLKTATALDFETKDSYTVRVRTTDAGGLWYEEAFVISVNDVNEVPTDIDLSNSTIAENAGADAVVGTLSTTDVDAGDSFTYTLVAGTGDDDNAAFNISGDALRANASFNFEVKDTYTVRVRSTDSGGLWYEEAFVVTVTDVNDNPTAIALSPADIDENAAANAVVGALSTTDEDASESFTYTLVTGAGDDDNAAFDIDGANLTANAGFDFETKDSYTVRVRSTDAGGLWFEQAFVVTVNDINEVPTDIALSNSTVAENAGANAVVGTLSTTDVDAGDTFTYTLVAGTGDDDNAAFNISGDALRATASFDFETKDTYTVRVRSTDAGGLWFEEAFTITVTDENDAPTAIALTPSAIDENLAANTVVGSFSTTDQDAGDTFTYSLVAGTGDADNGAFTVDGGDLKANASFDFETKDSYTVRVRSTDAGGLFFEEVIVISVNDVNETPTDIALSANVVLENAVALATPVTVGTLTAVDPDTGDSHTFALVNGMDPNDNALFEISGDVLSVKAGTVIDFETKNSYTVRVEATDGGGETFAKDLLITVGNRGEVEIVTIGDGTAQRSLVSGVTVTFDSAVTIDTDAFSVIRRGVGGGPVDVSFTTMIDGLGRTVASLTFSGSLTEFGSLVDGNYELHIDGSKVSDAFGDLDLDEDGTDGGNYLLGDQATDNFFRMFGDINGDRNVGFVDFVAFRNAFGSSDGDGNFDERFNFNGDTSIGFQDFVAFRNRFGNNLGF